MGENHRFALIVALILVLATWDVAGQSQVQADSASLDQTVAEALQNNPELQAAKREQEAAEQRIAPAGALDDPMLEAGFLNLPMCIPTEGDRGFRRMMTAESDDVDR